MDLTVSVGRGAWGVGGDRMCGSMHTKFKTRQNYVPLIKVRTAAVFVGEKD